MTNISNQDYLLSEQYKDASNLNARIQLHQRFSTNPYGWHRWVFDRLKLSPTARILELGTGPADLWVENLWRVPHGWRVTLSDLSPGMVAEARQNLATAAMRLAEAALPAFAYEVIDAQSIPLPDDSLDAVIANHMLYHVPDRPKALGEIRRVLKAEGSFYAATNGETHMIELWQMLGASNLEVRQATSAGRAFGLENGGEQLAPWFSQISLHRYEDSLRVMEVEALVTYVRSNGSWPGDAEPGLQQLVRSAEDQLRDRGYIHISKSTGLFEARGTI